MQGLRIQLLCNNIGVAIQAQIRHPGAAPEGRMTGCTTSAALGMRADTAELFARLGIKQTRAEKNVALQEHHDRDEHSCRNCKNNARTCKTSNP